MRKRKRMLPYLYLGILFFIGLGFFVYVTDPTGYFTYGKVAISYVFFFFGLAFITAFFFFSFFFLNHRQGTLIALCIDSLLILRYFGHKGVYYIPLVIAIFLLVDYLFKLKPKVPKRPVGKDPFPLKKNG